MLHSAGEALLAAFGVQEGSCPGVGGFDVASWCIGRMWGGQRTLAQTGCKRFETACQGFSGRPTSSRRAQLFEAWSLA